MHDNEIKRHKLHAVSCEIASVTFDERLPANPGMNPCGLLRLWLRKPMLSFFLHAWESKQQSFIRAGSAPRSNPPPFYIMMVVIKQLQIIRFAFGHSYTDRVIL